MLDHSALKKLTEVDNVTGCYHWNGPVTKNKPVSYKGGVRVYLRSYVYVQRFGPIPRGNRVVMSCGNWDCLTPSHMALQPKIPPRSA